MKSAKLFRKAKSFKGSPLGAGSSNKFARDLETRDTPNRADKTLTKLKNSKGTLRTSLMKGGKRK